MTPADLERVIRRDPAGRGLTSGEGADDLCRGHLAGAAESLAAAAQVAIVTGFFVPDAVPPAAETDGLCGSLLLADVLRQSGIDASVVTDELCAGALSAALKASGRRGLSLEVCPSDVDAAARWRTEFWNAHPRLTHLVAVERSGPSRAADVDARSHGRCHNMRGVDIHHTTADLHLLFEQPPRAELRTIGICDGGNEIGAGSLPAAWLAEVVAGGHGARIASRTATDWTILAGVSDWGAFALAAAVCLERGDVAPLVDWPGERIERALSAAVVDGSAIDGVTRRPDATVDGLPLMTYLQPWLHIYGQLHEEQRTK